MECKKCFLDLPEKDFYSSNICYKCSYNEKSDDLEKNKTELKQEIKKSAFFCKFCKKLILSNRKVYCSDDCRKQKTKENAKNLWFRKINITKSHWKYTNFKYTFKDSNET